MLQWLEGGEYVSVTSGSQPVSQWDKQSINQAVRRLTNQPTNYSARQPVIQARRVFNVEITHEFRYCTILQMQHKWQQWDTLCIHLSMPHTFTGRQSYILLFQCITARCMQNILLSISSCLYARKRLWNAWESPEKTEENLKICQ
jgi:hypothetical protein